MELAPDDDVGVLASHDVEERRKLLRVQIHVRIEKDDVVAHRDGGAAHDGIALALVPIVAQHADVGVMPGQRVAGDAPRVVVAAVVDDDDFEVVAQAREGVDCLAQVALDVRRLVEGRHDDADLSG